MMILIKGIEADLLKKENEIAGLKKTREEQEGEVINMEMIMDNIEYYLASLENLLLGSPDPLKSEAYFGVLFQQAPTYQELISGTFEALYRSKRCFFKRRWTVCEPSGMVRQAHHYYFK